jgi:hypothetical protein
LARCKVSDTEREGDRSVQIFECDRRRCDDVTGVRERGRASMAEWFMLH